MAQTVLTPLDFGRLEALNMRVHNLPTATPPASPVTGQLWYDSTENRLKYWDGGPGWVYADGQDAAPLTSNAPTTIAPDAVAAVGSGTAAARDNHVHGIAADAPLFISPDAIPDEGTSSNFARADHVHGFPTAAPSSDLTANTTNGEGTGSNFARATHSHAIQANVEPLSIDPDDAASVGSSPALARSDHQHAIAAAAPTTNLGAQTSNQEGIASSFARSDHMHGVVANVAPSALAPDIATAVGTNDALARADHVHNVPAAAPTGSLSATSTNSEGNAGSFARSDHLHDIADVFLLNSGDTFTGNLVSNGTAKVTGLPAPTADTDAATKGYVDAASQGLDVKASVRVASTTNIGTLSGLLTIDGVTLVAGNRVLVKDQTTASANGIYVAASGAWTRASDFDSSAEASAGAFTFVEEGTTQADSGWVLTTNDPITLGTTALTFVQFSGAGQIDAGAGLTKTGNTLDVGAGNGVIVNADDITLDWGEDADLSNVNKSPENMGFLQKVARAGHKHDISTAGPTLTLGASSMNAEGSSSNISRSDHSHSIDDDYVLNAGDTMTGNLTISHGGEASVVLDDTGSAEDFCVSADAGTIALARYAGGLRDFPRIALGAANPFTLFDSAAVVRAEWQESSVTLKTRQGNQLIRQPVPNKVTADVGNGVATSFVITHNMNTRYVKVEVFRNATPWDTVVCDVERTTLDTVTVRFAVAPAASAYSVVVMG